jgi:hypothetical protein
MFDEARAVGIIAEELDSHANSHVQVARRDVRSTPLSRHSADGKVRASAEAPHGLGRGCRQQVHDLIGGEHVGEADEQCVQRGIVRFVRHCGVGI